ncbi:cytochrome c-type biogenesis protein [Bosea sp. 2RAB26]|jgi:cytochrome c-type biogenesis protein CcmH|uniref:cytochrome c-type biogenesis protein n=1 Tax=Bosea sp. 2RAB26 TaxID=3237476 RepID=UPI003F913C40
MRRVLALLMLGLLCASPVRAVQPDEVLPNATLEQRARQISGGLRCLVCQNQSIDDSDAPLARDLRILVRERLVAGDTDEAVRDFVVARYGNFVLLSPPLNIRTIALWVAPFLILAFGLAYLGRRSRLMRTSAGQQTKPLSDDEQARVDALIRRDGN